MTTRLTIIVVTGVVAIILAWSTAWFLENFERVDAEAWVGYRGEARYNPYYAAERLLIELGHEADSLAGRGLIERLPDAADTLFLAPDDYRYTRPEVDALLDWAARGGHLVVEAPEPVGVGSPVFLDAIGIGLIDDAVGHDDTPAVDAGDAAAPTKDDEPRAISDGATPSAAGKGSDGGAGLTTDDDTLAVDVLTPRRLALPADDGFESYTDRHGAVVAARNWGEGFVTILASARFATNAVIGDHDHARLLAWLLTDPGVPGKTWFVYTGGFPSLWQLLLQHAWPALAGAALLLAAFLVGRGGRFGPPIPARPQVRRSLAEHVDACGSFLIRARAETELVEAVRDMIAQELEGRHHGIGAATRAEQAQAIARHTGRPPDEVAALMTHGVGSGPRDFSLLMGRLQELWKSL